MLLAGCISSGDTGLGLELVSDEQVEQMGVETWQRMQAETPASTNQEYQATADRISSRLLEAAGLDAGNWEVQVFQGDQANAFALPGRKIGIYEGMFATAQNDAQLAAVVGHEIGHVQYDHSQQRVSSQVATQGAIQLVGTALQVGNVAYANAIAGALGAGAQYGVLLPYGRNQELESDRYGLNLMAEAGYDPREAIAFWQQMEQAGGERPPEFLSTHPAPGNRIQQLQDLMPEALAIYEGS